MVPTDQRSAWSAAVSVLAAASTPVTSFSTGNVPVLQATQLSGQAPGASLACACSCGCLKCIRMFSLAKSACTAAILLPSCCSKLGDCHAQRRKLVTVMAVQLVCAIQELA